MRSTLAIAIPFLSLMGMGVAEAADPTLLAETGGFLLGNAQRCGVPIERVERAGKVIQGFIAIAANDPSEAAAADQRFAETFLASAHPERNPQAFASCTVVIQQFERLERHHEQAGSSRGTPATSPDF
jgi:hypothetical protein